MLLALTGAQVIFLAALAHATQCYVSCVPDPQPPPLPEASCTSSNISGIQPTVAISGTVTNARGLPVANACVYWSSAGDYAEAKTTAAGAYTITVIANKPVTLTVSHPHYQFRQLTISNPLLAAASPQNFAGLIYLLSTSVTPVAFNNSPQKTLTFSTYSTAPQSGSRVIVQLPAGGTVALTYDLSYTDPVGWKRWTGTWQVPTGTADGIYSYKSCVLDSAATGTCDAPGGTLISQVKSSGWNVDSFAPVLAMIAPLDAGNTIYSSQPIVVSAKDVMAEVVPLPEGDFKRPGTIPGSGIDPASLQIVLRNVTNPGPDRTLGPSLAGDLLRATADALTPGSQYQVTATARDFAGNSASTATKFLVMRSASATRPQVWIDAVPADSVQPGGLASTTDTYIWNDVTAKASSFTVTLDQTLHPGDGTVQIDFSPSNSASVTYTVGGVPGPVTVRPVEQQATLSTVFSTEATGLVTPSVSASSGRIGRVTAQVPKGADVGSVRLAMNSATATGARLPTCADPTAGQGCLPDPLVTFGRQESRWRPWADLASVDPYLLPESVAALPDVGLAPLPGNLCTGSPTLSSAVSHLSAVLARPLTINPDITINQAASDWLAQIIDCAAIHIDLLSPVADGATPTAAQRKEWLAAERDLLGLIRAFPAEASVAGQSPCFVTPGCEIQVGGQEANHYTEFGVVIVDTGDSPNVTDTYNNAAGGGNLVGWQTTPGPVAPPPLSVAFDRAGKDSYCYLNQLSGPGDPNNPYLYPSHGAGSFGGLGLLVDGGGDDTYSAYALSQGAAQTGAGYLLDLSGSDIHRTLSYANQDCLPGTDPAQGSGGGLAMGSASVGYGFLVDASGPNPVGAESDSYTAYAPTSIAYAERGGVGLIIDQFGDSTYVDRKCTSECPRVSSSGFAIASATLGGAAVLLDESGTDNHSCEGAFLGSCIATADVGGFALLHDAGLPIQGGDTYSVPAGGPSSTGIGVSSSAGLAVLADEVGQEHYSCAAAHCLGVGVGNLGSGLFLETAVGTDGGVTDYYCVPNAVAPLFQRGLSGPLCSSGNATRGINTGLWLGESTPVPTVMGYGVDLT
jgi:hypothetical protein